MKVQAATLLSLFTAIASLTSDSNVRRLSNNIHPPKPSSSSLKSSQGERKEGLAATNGATFAPPAELTKYDALQGQPSASRRKTNGKQRRVKRAMRPPLVDSDLLRFLSEQKRLTSQQLELEQKERQQIADNSAVGAARTREHNEEEENSNSTFFEVGQFNVVASNNQQQHQPQQTSQKQSSQPSVMYLETLFRSFALFQMEQNQQQQKQQPPSGRDIFQPQIAGPAIRADDEDTAWLGQYNQNRVASVLYSRAGSGGETQKLDPLLVARAGERVQSQALARTARRRVRIFLKERDREWTSVTNSDYAPGQQQQEEKDLSSMETRETMEDKSSEDKIEFDLDADDESDDNEESDFPETDLKSYSFEDTVDLLLEYGLNTKDVCEILIHSPGVALMRPRASRVSNGESLQDTMDRIIVGLLSETLKLRKYDARKVLRQCPSLLTMRGSRSAENVVKMLSRLGVSTNSIARDKPGLPKLLLRPPSALFRLISFLASDAVRMPVQNIGPLLRRAECQALLDVVAPVPTLAEQTREFGMLRNDVTDPSVVAALWGRSSQQRREIINDTYRKMSNTAWTLRHEIGTADLGKVVAAYPSVLLQDAEKQILPAAGFLMNELGIWEDDLPRVLQLYPALLGIEIHRMRGVADYLLSLEVEQESLGSIFRSFPALLTMDVENEMKLVVDFLQSTIGIVNIGRFVTRLPAILTYSIEDQLEPKWEFLQAFYVDPRFEATRFPAYFSYPLDRVIKTRFSYLKQVKRVPTQLIPLEKVLSFGDKDFAVKVARDSDEGKTFAAFAEKRKIQKSSR